MSKPMILDVPRQLLVDTKHVLQSVEFTQVGDGYNMQQVCPMCYEVNPKHGLNCRLKEVKNKLEEFLSNDFTVEPTSYQGDNRPDV